MARKLSKHAAERSGRTAAKHPAKTGQNAKAAKAKKPKPRTSSITPDRLEDYVRAHAEGLMDDPNITSVGVGYKEVAGAKTPTLAIQFTVASKIQPQDLTGAPTKRIPATLRVGSVDVPTDVIERSFAPSYELRQAKPKDPQRRRAQTLQPGMSVGGSATGGGTIGCFVTDRRSGGRVLLSNWHVLQGPEGRLGNDIAQPGKHDDNRIDQNRVGEVLRSHLGPAGDCAIASVGGRAISNAPLGLDNIDIDAIGKPALKDRVVKSGRTTGVTFGRVSRIGVNTRMNYGGGVSCIVGGFEIAPDTDNPAAENEISRRGDSGAAWLAVGKNGQPTSVMLGLHFAGDEDDTVSEIALACYAESVMNKLEIEPLSLAAPQNLTDEADGLRTGFAPDFLPFRVGVRGFTPARKADLARLSDKVEIPYCHFSVWLSKSRQYPLCVAWNTDGSRYVKLNRKGFRTDRRGDLEDYQLTDALYVNNPLDKGHIARRADLCWGSRAEAEVGNYDSFYFTNIAPQHQSFNQSGNRDFDSEGGVWGRLENTIFDSESPHDLKVSLMAGPVFGKADPVFEQNSEKCRVPKAFWKVVAFTDDVDGREKVFGFYLTQAEMLKGLTPEGIDLSAWIWARISLADLEQKTGVRLEQSMHDREVPFTAPQALADGVALKPVMSRSEYFAG